MRIKKILIAVAVVLLFSMSLIGCSNDTVSGDVTVTDALEREVLVPNDASTFVCIGPGCLRLYCYVADTSKLVGREDMEKDVTGRPYMMANSDLVQLPIIGAGGPNNSPDAEKLLTAAPDVIFTTYNSDASSVDELQNKTGIPVVALNYGKTAVFDPSVDTSISIIGKVTGNEKRSEELISYFNDLKEDLKNRTENIADTDKPRVYLGAQSMRGAHGIESTSGNFSLFNAIGAKNVVDAEGIKEYAMLDKEKLLEMDPDVMFIDAGGYSLVVNDYKTNPSYYESLKSVKNGKVFMQLPYNYYSTNIEIAIADAYYMGTVLYPQQFADVDYKAKFNEITKFMLNAELYDEVAQGYFGGYQEIKLSK